jgi:dTDP-4-amino-4,6-dideoxygalactose transaminase
MGTEKVGAMKIPFQNLKQEYRNLKEEIDSAVASVLDSGQYILGENVAAFEHEFATYCGVKYGVGVASGTDALTLALNAIGVGQGDEVITVPNTYIATADAIARNNATPVFVDIDPMIYTINIGAIKAAITNRTRAIIPVHLYGHPADMQPIMEIAKEHDLFVIEDACQAHGAEYRGKKTGSLGDIAAFSFYPTKNLGCCGDGGMVVTDSNDIADDIRGLRNYGQHKKHEHVYVGYNSRLDELQAAILRVKLKHLDEWIGKRRKIAGLYDELLPFEVLHPISTPHSNQAYHLYVIQMDKRDEMQRKLSAQGIGTAIHYPTPIHLQKAYNYLGYSVGAFPHVESIANRILSLPMHPYLKLREIEYIADAVRDIHL